MVDYNMPPTLKNIKNQWNKLFSCLAVSSKRSNTVGYEIQNTITNFQNHRAAIDNKILQALFNISKLTQEITCLTQWNFSFGFPKRLLEIKSIQYHVRKYRITLRAMLLTISGTLQSESHWRHQQGRPHGASCLVLWQMAKHSLTLPHTGRQCLPSTGVAL